VNGSPSPFSSGNFFLFACWLIIINTNERSVALCQGPYCCNVPDFIPEHFESFAKFRAFFRESNYTIVNLLESFNEVSSNKEFRHGRPRAAFRMHDLLTHMCCKACITIVYQFYTGIKIPVPIWQNKFLFPEYFWIQRYSSQRSRVPPIRGYPEINRRTIVRNFVSHPGTLCVTETCVSYRSYALWPLSTRNCVRAYRVCGPSIRPVIPVNVHLLSRTQFRVYDIHNFVSSFGGFPPSV